MRPAYVQKFRFNPSDIDRYGIIYKSADHEKREVLKLYNQHSTEPKGLAYLVANTVPEQNIRHLFFWPDYNLRLLYKRKNTFSENIEVICEKHGSHNIIVQNLMRSQIIEFRQAYNVQLAYRRMHGPVLKEFSGDLPLRRSLPLEWRLRQ